MYNILNKIIYVCRRVHEEVLVVPKINILAALLNHYARSICNSDISIIASFKNSSLPSL